MDKKGTHKTNNQDTPFYGFVHKSEKERLKENLYRSDMEKFKLFTQMLMRNAMLKKAVITMHKAEKNS